MKDSNKNLIGFRVNNNQKKILEEYVKKTGLSIPIILRELIETLEKNNKEYNPIEELEKILSYLKNNSNKNVNKNKKEPSIDLLKTYILNFKECSQCKKIKNIDEFYKDEKKYLGVKSKCKICDNKERVKRKYKNMI